MGVTQSTGTADYDPATLRRAQAGDPEAFGHLVQPLQDRLLRQAHGLCRDAALAEDLVSETLVEAWRCLGRFGGSCRLSTWLFAILLHRHQKASRRARTRPVPLASLPPHDLQASTRIADRLSTSAPSPAESLALNERSRQLRTAIDRLPEAHRRVILLRFFEDASLVDMAAVMGCSPGTVKSRLHYGLKKLRHFTSEMNLGAVERDTGL